MYRLCFQKGTASFGPQAVLEEAKLPYELVSVDTSTGEHRRPDYLAINPLGLVPALVTPQGETLYESAAILLYLADRHHVEDLAPPVDDPLRGLFYRSLFYLSKTVQTAYKRFHYPERFSSDPGDAPCIKAKAVDDLVAGWRAVDVQLAATGPYHLGARFSLADIYLVMLATWFDPPEELRRLFPAVANCFDLVAKRPAIRRCLERQDALSVGKT